MAERLESERRLLATDREMRNSGGMNHRDHAAHLRAVADRGSSSLHEPRRVPHPSLAGTVRTLIDKVGGSK
jgi:hypothetical protein